MPAAGLWKGLKATSQLFSDFKIFQGGTWSMMSSPSPRCCNSVVREETGPTHLFPSSGTGDKCCNNSGDANEIVIPEVLAAV